jgi:hypothetical protein
MTSAVKNTVAPTSSLLTPAKPQSTPQPTNIKTDFTSTTYYKVETSQGTKVLKVDYTTGETKVYNVDPATGKLTESPEKNISGRLVGTYWERKQVKVLN